MDQQAHDSTEAVEVAEAMPRVIKALTDARRPMVADELIEQVHFEHRSRYQVLYHALWRLIASGKLVRTDKNFLDISSHESAA